MVRKERDFAYVMRRLNETRGRWPDAAKGSGVPISTIRKIGQGQTDNPGAMHIDALAAYFERLDEFEAQMASRAPASLAAAAA